MQGNRDYGTPDMLNPKISMREDTVQERAAAIIRRLSRLSLRAPDEIGFLTYLRDSFRRKAYISCYNFLSSTFE